jgi:hypothetical protein
MDLLALRNRVANATGLNPSSTSDASKVDAWINAAYRYISGLYAWPWLMKQGTIVTYADITTGTASINSEDTALTFSSAPSVSVANDWMIQFDASSDWYDITSHTASSTSATLSTAYNDSSSLSAGDYLLRKIYYSLPSDLDTIVSLRQMRSKVDLVPLDPRFLDMAVPDPNVTGQPTHYVVGGLDSSNYWRVSFYPTPVERINVLVRYLKKITDLSATTDTPIMPEKWHTAIVHAALALYGYQFIDDTRQKESVGLLGAMLSDMKQNSSPVPGAIAKPLPWDMHYPRHRSGLQIPDIITGT